MSVSARVAPGASETLTLTLGWYFPFRDHYNYNPNTTFNPFGNKYASMFSGSIDAAWGHLKPGTEREAALVQSLDDISRWHAPFLSPDSSVPAWLSDQLVNSVSHTRDSMWWQDCPHCHPSTDPRVEPTKWGTWRQFEANDCPDIDSIHNDGERHIPYIMMMTDGTRSKLAAWAGNQQANGMLAEQILNTQPDMPQGRIMSDSTSMFIVYVLELYKWDADVVTLKTYWPVIQKAVSWINSTALEFGVPYKLETTYDVLGFPKYELSTYASAFHILALMAARELGVAMQDASFARDCDVQIQRAQSALDALQWNVTEGFYNAGSDNCTAEVGCERGIGIFSDAFYAQVLAYSVGLGDLLARPERLDQHLQYVAKKNCIHNDMTKPSTPLVSGCPNGLVTMTGRLTEQTDLSVWEMATFDHAALMLRRATSSAEADASLALAEGTGTSYAKRINDQWNTAGVKFNDGNPSVTSHYGYHMTSWHLLFGLSGQLADFSDEHNASLTFAPPAMDCGFSYPVLLPGAVGSIRCEVVRRTKMGKEAGKAEEEKRTFTLVFYDAPASPWRSLKTLAVRDVVHSSLVPIMLQVNSPVTWS